jgi:hypothetical protein
MDYRTVQQLRDTGASVSTTNKLLSGSAFESPAAAARSDFDAQMSGNVRESNSAGSVAARRKEKNGGMLLYMMNRNLDDFYSSLSGGSDVPRGMRRVRGSADANRAPTTDAERARAADGEDGNRAPTADAEDPNRAPTADAEDGPRITDVDAPDSTAPRAVTPDTPEIDAQRTAVADVTTRSPSLDIDTAGSPRLSSSAAALTSAPVDADAYRQFAETRVMSDAELRTRAADVVAPRAPDIMADSPVSGTAPDIDETRIVTPDAADAPRVVADAPTMAVAPDVDTAAPRPATLVDEFQARAISPEFSAYAASNNIDLDTFGDMPRTPSGDFAGAADASRLANVDMPDSVGGIRGARAMRMLIPGAADAVLMAGVAGAVGIFTGGVAFGQEADVSYNGVGYDFNGKAAGETLPGLGTYIAFNDGRNAEGTVRGIEDFLEIASPFAFAAAGATIGAVGTSWTGPGSAVGAFVGGVGGFLAGGVAMLLASEATRSIARGIGFEDVDRGLIGSLFAPEYAEQMEGWVRNVRDDQTLFDVLDEQLDAADTDAERTAIFRDFMRDVENGVADNQLRILAEITESVVATTGYTTEETEQIIMNPESRAHLIAFYEQSLAEAPDAADIAATLASLQQYDELDGRRIEIQAAAMAGEIMNARELNESLEGSMRGLNLYRANDYANNGFDSDPMGTMIEQELAGIDFNARLDHINGLLVSQNEEEAGDVLISAFETGTDIYTTMGSTEAIYEIHSLVEDATEQLMQSQSAYVAANWDALQVYMEPNAVIDNWWWQSDTTLLAAVEERLADADASDPEAIELQELLSATNNLQNITQEQAVILMNNNLFASDFRTAMSNDDEMTMSYFESGFDRRAMAIDHIQGRGERAMETVREHGFEVEALDPQTLEQGAPTPTQPGPSQEYARMQ